MFRFICLLTICGMRLSCTDKNTVRHLLARLFNYLLKSIDWCLSLILNCEIFSTHSKGKGKGKGQNIALKERTPHRATERHLSYGITQCYLPPDTGERALP